VSARDLLERSVSFEVRDDGDEPGDGLTLEGMAAMFGQSTEIDSWEGSFTEQIRAGAFKKSLRERSPVMQFDHGRHPLIGSLPIGRIEDLRETDEGLYVAGRITDNWLMQPVRDAIAEGSVNGMSFRFSVVREEWTDGQGKRVRPEELDALLWNPGERGPLMRTLTEVKLHELGPVVFPAYAGTSVGVRARDLATTIRDDDGLRRQVRRSLACQADAPGTLPDSELRQLAWALLFDRDAPPSGHPSPAAPAATEDRTTDAPADGHPPVSTDAPPSDGHPSPPPTTSQALRSEIADKAAWMREYVASIADKEI
jgi:HK97 family phage prohead protease